MAFAFGGGVVRENASHAWESVAAPTDVEGHGLTIQRLVSFRGMLLGVSEEALLRYEAEDDTWHPVDLAGQPIEIVQSSQALTASSVDASRVVHIQRSFDGVSWEALSLPAGARLTELVAGPDYVLAANLTDLAHAYRCDEAAHAFVETTHALPVLIAQDGSALFQQREGLASAPSLEAGTTLIRPGARTLAHTTTTGFLDEAFVDGDDIVLLEDLGTSTLALRITPRVGALHVLGAGLEPAPLTQLVTDGVNVAVRARIDGGDDRTFVVRVGETWRDVTPRMNASFDQLAAVDGLLLTRPGEYGLTPPQTSDDGGSAWRPMRVGFPQYDTNAGTAMRRVTDFERGPDGLLYASTNGGTTSICCTGSMVPWGYRPGAGIWRWDGARWSPVNAGIPIAAEPDGLGGPPFREDVLSLASQGDSLFAVLANHGVMRLVGDRWRPASTGLPIDATPALVALDDALIGRVGSTLYQHQGALWIAQGTVGMDALAGVHDVLVRGGAEVQMSHDAGRTWSPLPSPPSPVRGIAISHEHIVVRSEDEHLHALALRCEGGA